MRPNEHTASAAKHTDPFASPSLSGIKLDALQMDGLWNNNLTSPSASTKKDIELYLAE